MADREVGERAKKRAKITKDEVEITRVSHGSEKDLEPEGPPAIFELDFICPDSQPIKVADSLLDNQHLAMTLLNGIALPNDVELLQKGKGDNMAEFCYYAVKGRPCFQFIF